MKTHDAPEYATAGMAIAQKIKEQYDTIQTLRREKRELEERYKRLCKACSEENRKAAIEHALNSRVESLEHENAELQRKLDAVESAAQNWRDGPCPPSFPEECANQVFVILRQETEHET